MTYSIKIRRAIITTLSALVVVTLISLIYVNNKDINKFINYFNSKKYSKAQEFYLNVVNKSSTNKVDKFNSSIENFFKNKSKQIKDYCLKEHKKYDYTEELDMLDNMLYYNIATDEVNSVKSYVTKLADSRYSYHKAEEALNNKDYYNAVNYFNKVIKDDKNYSKAQKRIKEISLKLNK